MRTKITKNAWVIFLRKNAKALFLADPSLECFVSANKRRARGEGGGETVGVLASEKE